VTKEKFLRAIVGDPPLVVGHNENVELEAQLAEVKAELKARKEEVRLMVEEMGKMARDLATRKYPKSYPSLSELAKVRRGRCLTILHFQDITMSSCR
jgi:hypothetical protein